MKFDYVPAVDLGDPLTKRLGSYPRIPDLTWDTLRLCGSWLAVTLLRLQYRLTVKGQIPQGDRIAIVANHQSHLDTITLLAAIPAKIRHQIIVVLAAADYFFCQINWTIEARWWKPFQHLEVTFGEPYKGNDLDQLVTQLKQDLFL